MAILRRFHAGPLPATDVWIEVQVLAFSVRMRQKTSVVGAANATFVMVDSPSRVPPGHTERRFVGHCLRRNRVNHESLNALPLMFDWRRFLVASITGEGKPAPALSFNRYTMPPEFPHPNHAERPAKHC